MKTRCSNYSFARAHSEVRTKPYVYFHKTVYVTNHAVCKRRLHKRCVNKPVCSNYRPTRCMWPATAFSVARGTIKKKFFFILNLLKSV